MKKARNFLAVAFDSGGVTTGPIKTYKYMSYQLRDQMEEASKSIYKKPTIPSEVKKYQVPVDPQELLHGMTINKLHKIFQSVLKRQEDKIDPIRSKFGQIEQEEVSLPDKMTFVEDYAIRNRQFSFKDLLEVQCSKVQIIVTFLAMLELIKTGRIRISQKEIFGDIMIESLEDENTRAETYTEDREVEYQ